MVTLHRAPSWKISIYGRDHGLPHFHIEGKGWRCSVSIATLDLIIGNPPKAALAAATGWASTRQAELMRTWQELNP